MTLSFQALTKTVKIDNGKKETCCTNLEQGKLGIATRVKGNWNSRQ